MERDLPGLETSLLIRPSADFAEVMQHPEWSGMENSVAAQLRNTRQELLLLHRSARRDGEGACPAGRRSREPVSEAKITIDPTSVEAGAGITSRVRHQPPESAR